MTAKQSDMVHRDNNWVKRTSGPRKLVLCVLASMAAYGLMSAVSLDLRNRIMLSWDTFCLSMVMLNFLLFLSTSPSELCGVVEHQDDGLRTIFTIVLVAVGASVFGTVLLLGEKVGGSHSAKVVHTLVKLSSVVLSWVLLHTVFTVRYAHLYHDHNRLGTGSAVGGIRFPTKERPDYMDFAYFSFVVGMTFQVSDVQVESRAIRRFVLLHSLVSFLFNTTIVALTINAIAGLKK